MVSYLGFLSLGVRYFCLLGLTNFATCLLLFANFQVRLFLVCYFGLTYFAVTNFYLQIFGCILYCLLGLTDFPHLFVFMTVVVETFSSYIFISEWISSTCFVVFLQHLQESDKIQ